MGRRHHAAYLALLILGAGASAHAASPRPQHFANADNLKLVNYGQKIYQQQCGSCHGRGLQGQALWQLKDQFAGQRAPALGPTGPAWQLSDDDLFAMIKYGRTADGAQQATESMPKFDGKLKDSDIVAIVARIKRSWSIGLRATQAMLNPGFAGMPKDVGKTDWTLPPNCIQSVAPEQTSPAK